MKRYLTGVPSKAALAGHPLHPIFIVFPAAFLIGLLASDIVYLSVKDPFWSRLSFWLALSGTVMAGFAAIFGIIDFFGIDRVRELKTGWFHAVLNVAVLTIAIINTAMRPYDPAFIHHAGLVLSAVTAGLLLISAWLGGELTYRYGVGVKVGISEEVVQRRRYAEAA